MKNLADRIANLTPERRALLELKLKHRSSVPSTLGAEQIPPRRADAGPAPLSFAQQRLWFLNQLQPETSLYNILTTLRLEGALNVEALTKALDAIVARHETLRTIVGTSNGTRVQIVRDVRAVNPRIVDLSDLPRPERESELQQTLTAETLRPFDLSRDLMLRAALIKVAAAEHVLALVTHHIATDGWSIGVLLRDLGALYEAFSTGKPSPLPDLTIQYSDYAVWKRQWMEGEIRETQLSYWKQQLSGMSVLELPADRTRPAVRNYCGATQSFVCSRSLANQLAAMSRDQGVTLFMTLLAAFQVLLHRYTGQRDIAVGSPIAGRPRPEVEQLIGCFVNTLVLRTDLSGNPSFFELLGRVRKVCLGAYAHQDLPFEKLVEALHPERSLGSSPLFHVMFAHENLSTQKLELPRMTVTPIDVQNATAMFDLTLLTREDSNDLTAALEYSTELFEHATITRMLKHFETLLEGIVAAPNRRLSELPLLTNRERHWLLTEWNITESADPKRNCIHKLFEAQVERAPDVVALVCEDQQLTYKELNARANQLANYLIKLGVGPDVPVTICVERSLQMLVGVLGILKAGGAYVPLDPAYPPDRLAFILDDLRAPVVLTQQRLLEDLIEARISKIKGSDARSSILDPRIEVVCLDSDWEIIARESEDNPPAQSGPEHLAYVIYTSGSTGVPKGVEVPHRALTNYIVHAGQFFGLTPADRLLQFSSISFDVAAEEIFCSLTRGATLFLRNDSMLNSVAEFLQTCAKWRITVLDLPTAYWHELTARLFSEGLAMPEGIRLVVIGGERAIPERLSQWQACTGSRIRLCNAYGPTEAAIAATIGDLTGLVQSEQSLSEVPIGRPIPNVQVYVLDQNLNLVPVGVPGELFIGGIGLARSYLNRPELTAEKFIPNPFSEHANSRLYRTGDLVKFRADGNLEFVGRLDHQVKIRGFRIELGEIESVLNQHPLVREAVVLAREDENEDRESEIENRKPVLSDGEGSKTCTELSRSIDPSRASGPKSEKRLVAYVVPVRETTPNVSELRNFLSAKLPHYMVPSAFVFLHSVPLTPNGKVDRKALPCPARSIAGRETNYAAPRTDVEQVLASIWAEMLKLERVGIHDNFFELGGHSLLAVRLITEIEKALGRALRLSALFQAPTVEQLAQLLSQEAAPESSWYSLIPIQPKGSKLPFFWVHGETSDACLSRYLGPDQPLYGLIHQSLDGRAARYTSVEAIAAHYLSEIRTVQPHGPYLLGGYCFGGLVAWEMAQQLRKMNQQVGALVVLEPVNLRDCKVPALAGLPETTKADNLAESDKVESFRNFVSRHVHHFEALTIKEKLTYIWNITRATTNVIMLPAKKAAEEATSWLYLRLGYPLPASLRSSYILGIYERAMREYQPPVHPGPVTIFRSEHNADELHDWQRFAAGGLDIHVVPGNHAEVLKEHNVRVWAERLKACLDRAQPLRVRSLHRMPASIFNKS